MLSVGDSSRHDVVRNSSLRTILYYLFFSFSISPKSNCNNNNKTFQSDELFVCCVLLLLLCFVFRSNLRFMKHKSDLTAAAAAAVVVVVGPYGRRQRDEVM